MTSLRASLPDTASGLWRMDREYGPEEARVKHVVIHEAHLREVPDRHVVYRVDVFTQERNWCVYRRYSEFRRLHETLSERYRMLRGSFPPKQLSGNLSPTIIEERRSALEHYLLRIVNCHNREVASCPSVLKFLDLYTNDVYHVTLGLCRFIKSFGEAVLFEGHSFVMTPTQLFCIAKRLRIPNIESDYKADNVFCDLSSLYDFLSRLKSVTVKPSSVQDNGVRCEVGLMKSLRELNILTYSVSLLKGLSAVQLQLERLTACHAVTAMKDILIDSVLERKTQPRPPALPEGENSWRNSFNNKAFNNAFTIHPWISLIYLDLSHNTIRQLDDSFSLLPNLQELKLSHNKIEVLDLGYLNPALTKLTCSHSTTIKIICKTHESLAELILDHNMITELSGFNKLVHLKYLNLSSNALGALDTVACLTELPRLTDIVLKDNPLSKKSSYRKHVLCLFAQMASRDSIMVDGKPFSEKEKTKARSTRVKSSVPHIPVDLPFFSGSADQLPPAFMANRDDMWNTILHDTDISCESSPQISDGEEVGEMVEEVMLSPQSSARSTPRVYNWDPAEAFARSTVSSAADDLPGSPAADDLPGSPAAGHLLEKSPHGSSTCLEDDHTSSCCGSCKDEVMTSPMKDFNSIYYSITGSEMYPIDENKSRINPFGEPSQSFSERSSPLQFSSAKSSPSEPTAKLVNFAELENYKESSTDSLTSVSLPGTASGSPGEIMSSHFYSTEDNLDVDEILKDTEISVEKNRTVEKEDSFTLDKPDFFDQLISGQLPPVPISEEASIEEECTEEVPSTKEKNKVIESANVLICFDDIMIGDDVVGDDVVGDDVVGDDVVGDDVVGDDVVGDDVVGNTEGVTEPLECLREQSSNEPDLAEDALIVDLDELKIDTKNSLSLSSRNSISLDNPNIDIPKESHEDVTRSYLVEDSNIPRHSSPDQDSSPIQDTSIVQTSSPLWEPSPVEESSPFQEPSPVLEPSALIVSFPDPSSQSPQPSPQSPIPNPGASSRSPIYTESSSGDELVSSIIMNNEIMLERKRQTTLCLNEELHDMNVSDIYDDNCVSDESDELDFTNSKIKIQF